MPISELKITFLDYDSFPKKHIELPIDSFLGPQKYYSDDDNPFCSLDSSFIRHLYNAYIITNKRFALSYSNDNNSHIEFGEMYSEYVINAEALNR